MLSDIRMPGLSGLDVLKHVRATAPDTEVIISTGHANLETAIACLRAGAFDLLQKPFVTDHLLSSVDRALERKRLRSATSLYRACQVIFASPPDARLPHHIVDVAMDVMAAADASLMLVGPAGDVYVAYEAGAQSCPERAGAVIAPGEGVAGQVLVDRAPVLRVDDDGVSSIVYPLVVGERAVGVLNLRRAGRPAFSDNDVERAGVLASQVLLALENARLLGQVVAAERLACIGQLAASVAHEINNPAAFTLSALGFAKEALAELGSGREPSDNALAELQEALDDGIVGAERIKEIAADLKSLARSGEGVPPACVDVNDVVRSALRVAAAEVKKHGASVRDDLAAGVDVRVNPGKLSQVFLNLVVNAAQAMAGQATAKEIRLRTRRDGDSVVIDVEDSGPGIPPQHVARLFEAFFTTKGADVGTGLGLWISRQIVRGFGGELAVRTAAGAGACFTVVLPAAQADTVALAEAADAQCDP